MTRQPRRRWLWIVAGLLAAACSLRAAAQPAAQAAPPTADQVKAAYLDKFAGYVDWPPTEWRPN